jgi:hypothetical protein
MIAVVRSAAAVVAEVRRAHVWLTSPMIPLRATAWPGVRATVSPAPVVCRSEEVAMDVAAEAEFTDFVRTR